MLVRQRYADNKGVQIKRLLFLESSWMDSIGIWSMERCLGSLRGLAAGGEPVRLQIEFSLIVEFLSRNMLDEL